MASSREIIEGSPDLKRLFDDDFEIVVQDSHLLVSNVPYLDANSRVCRGVLILPLSLATDVQASQPPDHVAFFAGTEPHYVDKTPITGIINARETFKLSGTLVANFRFSSKPSDRDPDYDQKVRRYVDILAKPAQAIDPNVTAQTRQIVESTDDNSPLVFPDTNSARAQITAISDKLKGALIAIVGLGGTGSYILDAVAKTPVKEIHLFDDDEFSLHNSYRAPGAPTREQLRARITKVAYHAQIYSRMHKGICPHPERISSTNCQVLAKMTFVFLCMDPGPDKEHLIGFLVNAGIPFVDTGIGVEAINEKLVGAVNTIIVTPGYKSHIGKIPVKAGGADELYASNIQIAELNMLNAVHAVIRWKKHMGFYANERHEHESTYTIGPNMLTNEETNPPVC